MSEVDLVALVQDLELYSKVNNKPLKGFKQGSDMKFLI